MTCNSGAGPTEIAPVNGRSCAKIKNTDAATPVAKSPIVTAAASRLSLWTMAIAISAQAACKKRADHLTKLTSDLLIRIRCRRASNAFSSAVVDSRIGPFVIGPDLRGHERDEKAKNDP